MSLVLVLVAHVLISILPVKIAADLVGGRQTGIFSCLMAIIAALVGGIVAKTLIPIGLLAPLVYLLAAGFIEALYSVDPLQLVIDNEIIGILYRILRGVTFDEATLAKALIKNTLPGGNYLTQQHTLEHFRSEHHIPKCFNRNPRADWEHEGAKDMNQLAQERAIALLDSYNRDSLTPAVLKELERIYAAITKQKMG